MIVFDFNNTSVPVVVLGAGSIGERHIRNLWHLNFRNILVYRQRNLPFRNIGPAQVTVFTNWDDVVALQPFAAIICTPTAQHLQQVYDCLHAGIHVLVEKPLAHKLFNRHDLNDLVQQKNTLLQVGYMLRYHPLLQQVKAFIEAGTYGNVLNVQTYWGEYLPDWHSWEDYRKSYAAQKDGGGAALTLSHDVDVVNWLMSATPVAYHNMFNHASKLDVTADSACDIMMVYANKTTAHVHVNFHQRVTQRWYKIVFDNAVIDIDYVHSSITIATPFSTTTNKLNQFDRNDLFVDELADFFNKTMSDDVEFSSQQQIENSYSIIKACTNE